MKLFKDALVEALTTIIPTASAVAKTHGISQSQMSAFTSGGAVPKDDNIKKLCAAFSPDVSAKLAKAWVQERLGPDLADSILAVSREGGSKLELMFSALPGITQAAFLTLMEESRVSVDLRGSLEQLASYIRPDVIETPPATPRFSLTTIIGPEPTAEQHAATRLNEEKAQRPSLRKRRA